MRAMRKRQAEPLTCGDGDPEDYDVGLQVVGLFLILSLSLLAAAFPSIVRRFPRLPVPKYVLFLCRHFGTGVLVATAFCHLLPTAFSSMLDPCLPEFWTDTYPAMAGLIAMAGAYIIVGIEMVFVSRGLRHSHECELADAREAESRNADLESVEGHPRANVTGAERFEPGAEEIHAAPRPAGTQPAIPTDPKPAVGDLRPRHTRSTDGELERADAAVKPKLVGGSEKRAMMQCLLLEAGILFHSIFIGMTIAFSSGTAFVVLIIAISFHQIFEGLALGARIAAIESFDPRSAKPWLMALGYGVTAPVGQAIGLGVHGLFSLESQTGLLMQGIFNAISSGLLVYAGLVQLLAEDFLSEQSYEVLRGRRRKEACLAVLMGSALMAIVGAWA